MYYDTKHPLSRELEVCYPAGRGEILVRTSEDWDKDVEPVEVKGDGTCSRFRLTCRSPFLYFKACLRSGGKLTWAAGPYQLLLMSGDDCPTLHPYFFSSGQGRTSKLLTMPSKILGREHRLRAFFPPGYDENTLTGTGDLSAGRTEPVLPGRGFRRQ